MCPHPHTVSSVHARKVKMAPKLIWAHFDLACMHRYMCTTSSLCTWIEAFWCVLFNHVWFFLPCIHLKCSTLACTLPWLSPFVCTACAHYRVHISRSCWVSLKSSCQDAFKNSSFDGLFYKNKFSGVQVPIWIQVIVACRAIENFSIFRKKLFFFEIF